MRISGFIWLEEFEDKILRKHGVLSANIYQILYSTPLTQEQMDRIR